MLSDYGRILARIIETSRPSIFLQNLKDEVEITQSMHLIAIALIMGSAVMINLRILGLMNRDQPVRSLLVRFMPSLWIGVCVAGFTGLVMIMTEPGRSLPALQFQLKMLALIVAIAATCLVQRLVPKDDDGWSPGASAKLLATVSLGAWALIIIAGRWIAYA